MTLRENVLGVRKLNSEGMDASPARSSPEMLNE